VDNFWSIQGQLERDRAAVRVADNVRPVDPERPQQRPTVGRLLIDGQRPIWVGALCEAAAMIAHQAIPLAEHRLA